ncbi:MAG: PIN domain-containing protein [candidate division KSB1 bacterium]|nr:PIN domain-containing protein [candidate division KSB1 bacterium]
MRIYLDNCCFNRPFDDQKQTRIRLETEAKLFIQNRIINSNLEFVWSYILEYENSVNPFRERQRSIQLWRKHAVINISETDSIIQKAEEITKNGVKSKDALHIACSIYGSCDYFITTDDDILNKIKNHDEIKIIDPINFVRNIVS